MAEFVVPIDDVIIIEDPLVSEDVIVLPSEEEGEDTVLPTEEVAEEEYSLVVPSVPAVTVTFSVDMPVEEYVEISTVVSEDVNEVLLSVVFIVPIEPVVIVSAVGLSVDVPLSESIFVSIY